MSVPFTAALQASLTGEQNRRHPGYYPKAFLPRAQFLQALKNDPKPSRRELPHGKKGNLMSDILSEYQRWKQQGESLRNQAKQAMESRFRELLSEAVSIAESYRSDFGSTLKPPPPVTMFRYRAGKAKPKKGSKPAASRTAVEAPAPETKPQKQDPKIARLQKLLAPARKKLEDAKAAGAPTRKLEDRIYEIEDEIRLATQNT
jgi:hypothetical protein